MSPVITEKWRCIVTVWLSLRLVSLSLLSWLKFLNLSWIFNSDTPFISLSVSVPHVFLLFVLIIFFIFQIYKSGAVYFQWMATFFAFVVFCISWDQEWNVWRPRFLKSRQFWSFTANTAFDWRHTKHIEVGNKYEISTSSLIEIPSPTRPGTLFASVTSLNIDIEWCFHIFFPTRNVLFGGGW